MTHTPPPPYALYTCILYTYSHREGGEMKKRKGYRGNSSQSWVENTNMTDCIFSLRTLINTCRKAPLQVNIFRWRHIALLYMVVNLLMSWNLADSKNTSYRLAWGLVQGFGNFQNRAYSSCFLHVSKRSCIILKCLFIKALFAHSSTRPSTVGGIWIEGGGMGVCIWRHSLFSPWGGKGNLI